MIHTVSGEKFNDVGQMLEKMQEFVEQTEASLQSSRDKVENLREQYQTLTAKGADLQQSISDMKDKAVDAVPEPHLSAPVVSLSSTESDKKPENRVLKPQQEPQPLKQSVEHEPTNRSYLRK